MLFSSLFLLSFAIWFFLGVDAFVTLLVLQSLINCFAIDYNSYNLTIAKNVGIKEILNILNTVDDKITQRYAKVIYKQ